jgi:hypothetical protein
MKIRLKAAAVVVSAALLTGFTSITGATIANAEPAHCSGYGITHTDPGTYAYMQGTYNLKTGPYADCDSVTSVPDGTKFWIWCVVENANLNFWYYGRIAGTDTQGWMSAANLSEYGGNFGYSYC